MAAQYPLPLPFSPSFSADSFFVSPCNQAAYNWIMAWPHWPSHALLIYGAKGSGKSHLASMWAARSHATMQPAAAYDASAWPSGHIVLENIEKAHDATALLHLFNASKEQGTNLLITSAHPPVNLPFTLADLTSRLRAMPLVILEEPDDALLTALLRKHFADRQLKVEEDVIAYLVARMERKPNAVQQLVSILDEAAISTKKRISIALANKLINFN